MLNVGIIGAGRIGKVHCESIMRYVNEFYTDYHKIL